MSCHMEISTWNGNYKAYNRGPVRFPRPGLFHSKQAGTPFLARDRMLQRLGKRSGSSEAGIEIQFLESFSGGGW